MKSIRRMLPVLALVVAALPAFASARSWYVSPAGHDDTGDGTTGAPFRTLRRATNASEDGDAIRVLPGIYRECVDASTKSLSFVATAIEDAEPSNFVTIVDGTGICGGSGCAERRKLACFGTGEEQCYGACILLVCSATTTQHCLFDSDCPSGETCSGTGTTGICDTDTSAACAFDTCSIPDGATEGHCERYPTVACTADAQCANLDCEFGTCDRIEGTCSVSGARCATGADCPAGETCLPLSLAPVFDLGPGSTVTGFTIRGGGLSGVRMVGSGTLVKNRILGNRADGSDGGGVLATPSPDPERLRCWEDTSILCGDGDGCSVCRSDTSIPCASPQDCIRAGAGSVCDDRGPCLAVTELIVNTNAIEENAADAAGAGHGGGGLLVRADIGPDAGLRLVATANNVRDNDAAGDGGGIAVLASGAGRFDAQLRRNVFTANRGHDGGGAAMKATLSGEAARTRALILGNTLEANEASGNGGGFLADLAATGDVQLLVGDNAARGNSAGGDGGGMLLRAEGDGDGARRLEANGNNVSGNAAVGSGGGLDVALSNGPASVEAGVLEANHNDLAGNTAGGGGGGIRVALVSSGAAASADMEVEGNTVRKNQAGSYGGAVALLLDSEGAAGCSAQFSRNLLAENAATDAEHGDATGGGFFVYLRGAAGRADVFADFNTIVSNRSDAGAAAIEIESDGVPPDGSARLAVSNSILANNDGIGIGGLPPGYPGKLMQAGSDRDLQVSVKYSDVWGNTHIDYERTIRDELTHDDTNVAVDPKLGLDFALLPCSPATDLADPEVDFSSEPLPNGLRANLGHLGGTVTATPTLPDLNGDRQIDGMDLLRIAAAFASDRALAPEMFYAPADLDGNGLVDGDDLAFMAAFFGFECP